MNIEFLREPGTGKLEMWVGGQPAIGARVSHIAPDGDVVVVVPLKHAMVGELNNVIAFRTPGMETKGGASANPGGQG